jgi:cell division transport system permease protein
VSDEDIIILQQRLQSSYFVKSSRYISPEDAAKELTEELGEDFIDFLGYNPLPPSIDLRVKAGYANVDSLAVLEGLLMQEVIVKEVFYQKSLVHLINQNIQKIGIFLVGFSALLFLIAMALINNTIRLSVYSKRFIIKTMKLVGATRGFVSRPFLVKGILQGILSSFLAIVLLIAILYFIMQEVPELIDLFNLYLYLGVFGLVILTGTVLAWFSTLLAVRKYLKMKEDELYH